MENAKFGIGDLVEDKVTGFQGIVMAMTLYSTGCIHYGLTSQKLKEDGSIADWEWIDQSRIERVHEKRVSFKTMIKKPSGAFPNPPQQ